MGEVEFQDRGGDACIIADRSILERLAQLLGTSANEVDKALTKRTIATRGQVIEKPLRKAEALVTRDTFGRGLYDKLFTYVVSLINNAIEVRGDCGGKNTVIGVLDIYGFEIFQLNSFEQLCINYCNEKLQQLFIEIVLKREQEEYRREGIVWKDIDYFNNKVRAFAKMFWLERNKRLNFCVELWADPTLTHPR